jgi:hypothetical protein
LTYPGNQKENLSKFEQIICFPGELHLEYLNKYFTITYMCKYIKNNHGKKQTKPVPIVGHPDDDEDNDR